MITKAMAGGVLAALVVGGGLTACGAKTTTTTPAANSGTTAAGGGGGSATTAQAKLSKAQVIEQADKICAASKEQGDKIPEPTNDADSIRNYLNQSFDLVQRQVEQLRSLAEQAGDNATLTELIDELEETVRTGRDRIEDIVANSDILTDPNGPFEPRVAELQRRANEFGFKVCMQRGSTGESTGESGGGTATTRSRADGGSGRSTTTTTGADPGTGSGDDPTTTTSGGGGSASGTRSKDDCKVIEQLRWDVVGFTTEQDGYDALESLKRYAPPEVAAAGERIVRGKISGAGGTEADAKILSDWITSVCPSS